MTLYYQIIETSDNEETTYKVRTARNLFGLILSIPGGSRWVGKDRNSNYLWITKEYSDTFYTLEDAQYAAQSHANVVFKDAKKEKSTKTKIVQTIKIDDIKE